MKLRGTRRWAKYKRRIPPHMSLISSITLGREETSLRRNIPAVDFI